MIRRYTVGFVLFLSLVYSVAFAAPKTPSDPLQQMLDQVVTHQLSNGMRWLFLEDHSAPVVTSLFWVKTGSRNERPGITGISHLFEHMMFRGSAKYGPEEHAKLVSRHGGECNAFTTNDGTVYYEVMPSDQLELVIHLEAERFANLKLDSAVLVEEKKVVSEERRQRTDNDLFGAANEQLEINFYQSTTYSWPVIGWMHDILGYSLEDVQEYYRLHYAPNNVVGIIVGDFKLEQAMKLAEKYWGKIPAQPTPPAPKMVEVPQKGERRIQFKRPAELPMLFAAYHIPPQTDPDIPALEVLSRILSSGQSSRLYQRLVYKEQMVRFAGGAADNRIGPGQFGFWMGMKQGSNMDDAEKILWEEVERLRTEPVTESELMKAKNQLEAGQIGGLASSMSRAMRLGSYENGYGDYRKLGERAAALRAVTAEDVKRVAKKYLDPDQRTVLVVVPTKDETAMNDVEGGTR
ncbi:MAG: insulinase family protein [bacterium]|nr:insulinase family protein [bacterium]